MLKMRKRFLIPLLAYLFRTGREGVFEKQRKDIAQCPRKAGVERAVSIRVLLHDLQNGVVQMAIHDVDLLRVRDDVLRDVALEHGE